MSRFAPVVPAAVTLLLTVTACSGGVHGTPGGSGVHDPYFPKAGNGGRPPVGLERMLRLHFVQHWFNLSDPAGGGSAA